MSINAASNHCSSRGMKIMREKQAPLCTTLATLFLLSMFPGIAAGQTSGAATKNTGVAATQTAENQTAKDARHAQIAADTNKLFQMAQELKVEVAKSNQDILSVAVVKKADEIEKLAKSLKERMKTE